MARKTIKSLFDRDNLLNINNNFTELYQMIVNINIDTSGEIDDKLSKIKDELKVYSDGLAKDNLTKNMVSINYNESEDLFNKPPEGENYYTYAKSIYDPYFDSVTPSTTLSRGTKIIIEPGKWFFYRIKTTQFTENTFTTLAKITQMGTSSSVSYRFLAPGATTGAATSMTLIDKDENVYGVIGAAIEKGKNLEIRFDNRGNTQRMIVEAPVVFEGSKVRKSNSSKRIVNSLAQTINKEKKSYSVPVKTPTNFSVKNHPLVGKLITDSRGRFIVNYDVTNNKMMNGTTYFIDYANGNDSNDGLTKNTPFKSVRNAISICKDGDTLFLREGNHYRYNGVLFAKDFNKSINVIGENDNVNIIMADEPTWTKTTNQTKVYEFSRSSTKKVVDISRNYALTNVSSINDVNNTVDSWYTDGTKVYVNIGGVPDNNIVPIISSSNYQVTGITGNSYFENVNFFGGNNTVQLNFNKGSKAYFKNVGFYHSNPGYNGLAITGGDLAILDGCEANFNDMDGFNYHVGTDGSLPLIIEINCIGLENGSDKGTAGFKSNNGTTTHDGVKSIRVNGVYGRNDGGNVADVNVGTESWNLGCTAFESYQGKDFQTSSGGTMFLDSCIAYGSENSINIVDDTATTYIRMGEYQNKLITGKEVKY